MTIHRDGKIWQQEFREGIPQYDIKEIGDSDETGTTIHFMPDLQFFSNVTEFEYDRMDERLRETSFLNAGLEITLTDEVSGKEKVSHKYEGGIAEFVRHLGERAVSIHPEVIRLIGSREDSDGKLVEADIALLWSDAYSEKIQC